jgi:hypothetical protein
MGARKKEKGPDPHSEPAKCKNCRRKPPEAVLRKCPDGVICTRCLQHERNYEVIKNLKELSEGGTTLSKRRRILLAKAGRALTAVLTENSRHSGFIRHPDEVDTPDGNYDNIPYLLNLVSKRLLRARERDLARRVRGVIAWFVLWEKPRPKKDPYSRVSSPFWRLSLAGIAQTRDYLEGSWFRVKIPEGTETRQGGLLVVPCPCCAVVDTEAEAQPVLLSHAGEWTGRWDNDPVVYSWPPQPPPAAQYWTAYLGQCKACSAILWGVTEPTLENPKRSKKLPKSKGEGEP